MFPAARRRCLPLAPLAALALVFAFAPLPVSADPACEEQCGIAYWECSDACGAFGGPLCEQNCVNAHNSCMGQCASCPTVRYFTTVQVNSTTPSGVHGCYKNSTTGDVAGRQYQRHDRNQTVYQWRETTQCNGAKSTQLVSSGTQNVTCWLPSGQGNCSPYTNASLTICS